MALNFHKIWLVLALVTAVYGCKPNSAQKIPADPSVDKSALCKSGGATWDSAANECVCASPAKWNGSECVGDMDAEAKNACTESGGGWSDEKNDCVCPAPLLTVDKKCVKELDARETTCKESGGDWLTDDKRCECPKGQDLGDDGCKEVEGFSWDIVQRACKDADGSWEEDDLICNCADDEIFTGKNCTTIKQGMTKKLCESAVFPGVWTSGRCRCAEDDFVFTLGRGGCVPAQDDVETKVLKKICENKLNLGTWLGEEEVCECPNGQIWYEETCVEKSDLSSREVCESTFNKGVWSKDEKICRCKVGAMWVDQECKLIKDLSSQEACESDFNKGEWDNTLNSCICPSGLGWIDLVKRCDESGVSASAQLCIQSGGRPGETGGTCTCPSGMRVQTLQPQNYQYCVRNDDDDDEVPLWLLILLGI